MNGARLYVRYVAASIRAQMQYPASFLMLSASQFGGTFIEFLGIWALFHRFGQLRGWTIGEIAIFYGVVNISFAIADSVSRGFDVFGPDFVKTGNFDRLLLRPRSTTLQLLGHELRLTRIGRVLQGLVVFAIGVRIVPIDWSVSGVTLLLAAVASGAALFVSIVILQATLAIWTVEGLELANTLTYGGVQAAQYPLDIYERWFRDFLVFVVPIGCVSYFPVVRVLGRSDSIGTPTWLLDGSPAFGVVFLALALGVWRLGVRHYNSTGS